MFQSGAWEGYWEQRGFSRGVMRSLVLTFAADGTISGSGRDSVGKFTFEGTFTAAGEVTLQKQYIGAHAVSYKGRADVDGGIAGKWEIPPYDSGAFAMTPAACPPTAPVRKARARRPAIPPVPDTTAEAASPAPDTGAAVTPAEPERPHPLRRRRPPAAP